MPDKKVFLTRAAILAVQDKLDTQEVPCPEWGEGGVLLIRRLSVKEASDWRKSLTKTVESRDRGGKLVKETEFDDDKALENEVKLMVLGCVDEAGAPLFTDAGDVAALLEKSAVPVKRVILAISRFNNIRGELDDAIKN